ncbi:MAG TPA: hypothetical protein VK809_12890, partial [Bacteroidia bacterium]|nr:hypothetical protein [Bacteroidia bacterium]
KISTVLESATIFRILKQISYYTRCKTGNTGPLSQNEINKAFEIIVGTPPVDDSAIMLQRLPALGRMTSENNDRQFIDYYILDGLRADNLIDIVYQNKSEELEEMWLNPLQKTGIEIVTKKMLNDNSANIFIGYLKRANDYLNKVLVGDILASLVYYATKNRLNLNGLKLELSRISALNLSTSLIENFILKDCDIEELDISNVSPNNILFIDCNIKILYGMAYNPFLPPFMKSCKVDTFEPNSMNSTNRLFNLKPSHMILISLIKKIFFLDSKGREESELIYGFGRGEDRKMASAILKIMVRDKIVQKSKDNIITPKTFMKARMVNIIQKFDKSNERLWAEVGNLMNGIH